MKVNLIVAMTDNACIGRDNKMPWHLPADLQHFKHITMSKPIIMGRKTYESIGRPLPGRENIVLTRNSDYKAEGCTVLPSLDTALLLLSHKNEVMIIGGANLYQQALPRVDTMYITWVRTTLQGDTYFPKWNQADWTLFMKTDHPAGNGNDYAYGFYIYHRRNKQTE